jgi:hypothetical protein
VQRRWAYLIPLVAVCVGGTVTNVPHRRWINIRVVGITETCYPITKGPDAWEHTKIIGISEVTIHKYILPVSIYCVYSRTVNYYVFTDVGTTGHSRRLGNGPDLAGNDWAKYICVRFIINRDWCEFTSYKISHKLYSPPIATAFPTFLTRSLKANGLSVAGILASASAGSKIRYALSVFMKAHIWTPVNTASTPVKTATASNLGKIPLIVPTQLRRGVFGGGGLLLVAPAAWV